MVGKYLKVEPVAQYIIGTGANGKYFLSDNRLVYILDEFSRKCLVIPY